MKKRVVRFIGGILILVIFSGKIHAQLTARALGMGGAYTALARGAHAQAWNPANLGLPDNPSFSMDIFSVGANLSNNSFTKHMYDQYNGKYWDSEAIADILDHIPSNGLAMDVGASVRMLSFSKGRFALTFGADGGGFLRMDKSIFDLLLNGNELNKTYTLENAKGETMSVGYLGLSWGQPIEVDFADCFAIGWTTYIMHGIAYGHLDQSDVSVKTTVNGFNMDGTYRTSYGLGSFGMGIDLGAAARMNDQWTLSAGLMNLLSRVSWSTDAEASQGYFGGDSLAVLDFSDDDEKDDFQDSSWTVKGQSLSRGLPVVFRVGTAYAYEDVLFTADYIQGFKRRVWTATTPQLSLGAEWRKIKWLPLRMGFAFGGNLGVGTSFGFGLRPGRFALDLGILNRGFVTSGASKGLYLGLDIGVNLN